MAHVSHRPNGPSRAIQLGSMGLALAAGFGDLVEFLMAAILISAPLFGLLALMAVMVMSRPEWNAFVVWKHRDLLVASIGGLPFLVNIPFLARFLTGRHNLRREIARLARLKAGQDQAVLARPMLGLVARAKSIRDSCVFTWQPAFILAFVSLIGGGLVYTWPTVQGLVGLLFVIMWVAFALWVFVGWGAYACEPASDCETLEKKRQQLFAASRLGVSSSVPSSPAPPSVQSKGSAPPLVAPTSRATLPDDQVVKILARSIYREARQLGYTPQQVVALAATLIELVQQEMDASPPRAH